MYFEILLHHLQDTKLEFSNTITKPGFIGVFFWGGMNYILTNTYAKPKQTHTEEIKKHCNVHITSQYYLR